MQIGQLSESQMRACADPFTRGSLQGGLEARACPRAITACDADLTQFVVPQRLFSEHPRASITGEPRETLGQEALALRPS
jgi:hypothetical protein